MDTLKYALIIGAPLLVTACGGDSNTKTSTSSSSAVSSSISAKKMQLDFNESNCLTDHNADAVTDFDAFSGQRKMLSWNCVIDSRDNMLKKLNLVYVYDAVAGCYKKNSDAVLEHGALSTSEAADCSKLAQPVIKPEYSAELERFDVQKFFESDVSGAVSYEYSLKNTGNLPISQWRVVFKVTVADGPRKDQWFGEEGIKYQQYLFPGATLDTAKDGDTALYGNLAVNQLYNLELSIQDYYGNVLGSSQTQVIARDKP